MPLTPFCCFVPKRRKMAIATTSKETTQLRTMSKVSEVRIQLLGGLIPSKFFARKSRAVMPLTWCFSFVPKRRKMGQCHSLKRNYPAHIKWQRSRKFASSYWVVPSRAILKFSACRSRAVMPPTRFFSSVPKGRKMGQCHDLERNYPA